MSVFDWKSAAPQDTAARAKDAAVQNQSARRKIAAAKSIERIRQSNPSYGTVGIGTRVSNLTTK